MSTSEPEHGPDLRRDDVSAIGIEPGLARPAGFLDGGLRSIVDVRNQLASRVASRFWLACLVCVLLVALGLQWSSARAEPVDVASIPTASVVVQEASSEATEVTEPPPIVVHVAGEVIQPGLVTLDPGSRVAQAIDRAGGPTGDADLHRLNLALVVDDGTSITVPAIGDDDAEPLIRGTQGNAGSPDGPGASSTPINVNTADSQTLQQLPGVGPSTGDAIVEWRNENGPFASADDLLLVPGIGPAKLEAIRDSIVT